MFLFSSFRIFFLNLIFLFFSIQTFAGGGWISSGGEIFKFDRNPWFVAKNTPQAKYCLTIDKSSVSASEEQVRNSLLTAINWWKKELFNSKPSGSNNPNVIPLNRNNNSIFSPGPLTGGGLFQTGPEQFIENCINSDLEIKVGFSTLTDEEKQYLQGTNSSSQTNKIYSYIGVTVRKEYDLKTLKGKGFIYIASDMGPNAYKNSGELISQAWSDPKFLTYAFMHEMGHVLGFTHMGVGLMSEIFLDQLLNKRMASFYQKNSLISFLKSPEEMVICNFSGSFNSSFLMLKESVACLAIKKTTEKEWKVFKKITKESDPEEIGTLTTRSSDSSLDFSMTPGVLLQLPDEQIVFNGSDKGFASFLVGPVFQELQFSGYYTDKQSPRQYPVTIRIQPNGFNVVGNVSNQLLPVITYAPPTLLRMLFPIP